MSEIPNFATQTQGAAVPAKHKKPKQKAKKPSRAKRRKALAGMLPEKPQKWLVLAGTKEARDFIQGWSRSSHVTLVASLKGVTTMAADLGVETTTGGFSQEGKTSIEGLADYLTSERFDTVVDLTHPFAAKMSANGRQAALIAGCEYFQFVRAPWRPLEADEWYYHDSWEALFAAVKTRHMFVAGGHEALAALIAAPHDSKTSFTARMIEPADEMSLPANCEVILGMPQAAPADEEALFKKRKITAIAAKLSGGKASAGKLAAARALGLPVHLVKRPDYPPGYFTNVKALHGALARHLAQKAAKSSTP